MLGRSVKLHWGLGHKLLKTIYEGSPIPQLTNGSPVWDEVVVKQRNLRMLQRVHRLISIKSARRTELFLSKLMYDGWSSTHRNRNRGEGEAVQNKAQRRTKLI